MKIHTTIQHQVMFTRQELDWLTTVLSSFIDRHKIEKGAPRNGDPVWYQQLPDMHDALVVCFNQCEGAETDGIKTEQRDGAVCAETNPVPQPARQRRDQ